MRLGTLEVRRRVIVAIVAVITTTVAWYFWAQRTAPGPAGPGPAPAPSLQLAGSMTDGYLREQAEYFDPTPLFFPTPYNFGQGRSLSALQREPEEGFRNFEPSFRFPLQKLEVYGLESDPAPQRPSEILARGDEAPFAGIGRGEAMPVTLTPREAFIEVKSLQSNRIVISQALPDLALPRGEFGPLEFLVLAGPAGLVGEPLLVANSGSDQADAFFRTFLVRGFRLGQRLAPGQYLVRIGP